MFRDRSSLKRHIGSYDRSSVDFHFIEQSFLKARRFDQNVVRYRVQRLNVKGARLASRHRDLLASSDIRDGYLCAGDCGAIWIDNGAADASLVCLSDDSTGNCQQCNDSNQNRAHGFVSFQLSTDRRVTLSD